MESPDGGKREVDKKKCRNVKTGREGEKRASNWSWLWFRGGGVQNFGVKGG